MNEMASAEGVRAWARMVRAQQNALRQVERRLKRSDLPPLVWYDVLLELERAGEDGLRHRDIQNHTLLERYNVTRLVDRLEGAGLVTKGTVEGDARGSLVRITRAGRDLREVMWPVYSAAIAEAFSARFTQAELETLSELLGRI